MFEPEFPLFLSKQDTNTGSAQAREFYGTTRHQLPTQQEHQLTAESLVMSSKMSCDTAFWK